MFKSLDPEQKIRLLLKSYPASIMVYYSDRHLGPVLRTRCGKGMPEDAGMQERFGLDLPDEMLVVQDMDLVTNSEKLEKEELLLGFYEIDTTYEWGVVSFANLTVIDDPQTTWKFATFLTPWPATVTGPSLRSR